MTDTVTGDLLPAYVPPGPRRSHPGRLVAVGVGLAAALVAATFAAVSFGASDGSGSPEAAVERLFAAVEQEDLLGVLEALPPGERSVLRDGVDDIAGELQRLGILADDLDLGAVSGLDIEVEGLALSSTELAPGFAAVSIDAGTISATTIPGDLPLGPVVDGFLGDPVAAIEPETTTEDLSIGDPSLVAVHDDGGWHVSLFYSIAEAARRDAGAPLPPLGDGVPAEGSSSPDAAVRALFDAASDLDVRRLVALTPPDEMAALHDYAPLFLDDAEAAIAELSAMGEPLSIRVDHLGTDVDADGNTARVAITELRASVVAPFVGQVRYEWDGECARVVADGHEEESCLSELADAGYPLDLGGYQPSVVAVQRDGAWYVSPTRTTIGAVLDILRVVQRDDLEDPEALFWGLLGLGIAPGMGLGGPFGPFGFDQPSGLQDEGSTYAEDGWQRFDEESLVDPGRDPAVHDWAECYAPLEQLPPDAGSEDVAKAADAVDRCLQEQGGG